MSVIEGVLFEEIARLEKNINHYENMLQFLPRGTIFIRKMGNSSFAYRKRKEQGSVVTEYLGNINDNIVQAEIERSNEYKRIKNNIRIAKQELARLRKAYNVYLNKHK